MGNDILLTLFHSFFPGETTQMNPKRLVKTPPALSIRRRHRALPLSPLTQRCRWSRHIPSAGRGAGGEGDRATPLGAVLADVFGGRFSMGAVTRG